MVRVSVSPQSFALRMFVCLVMVLVIFLSGLFYHVLGRCQNSAIVHLCMFPMHPLTVRLTKIAKVCKSASTVPNISQILLYFRSQHFCTFVLPHYRLTQWVMRILISLSTSSGNGMTENHRRPQLTIKRSHLLLSGRHVFGWWSLHHAIAARCCAAWGKFRKLLPILTSKHISFKTCGKVFTACVRSTMGWCPNRRSQIWPSSPSCLSASSAHSLWSISRIMVCFPISNLRTWRCTRRRPPCWKCFPTYCWHSTQEIWQC